MFQTTNMILNKHHTLLYYLSLAMYPRMCFTVRYWHIPFYFS